MEKKRINVAVGVIQRQTKVLVGQRLVKDRYYQKWEFPGGKLDGDESPLEALSRELHEELGIQIQSARPLITLEHDYPDRHVRLFVFLVDDFSGEPSGVEGQALQWVDPSECQALDFLEANTSIVHAVQLPSIHLISNISHYGMERTLNVLRDIERLYSGNMIIQIRELDLTSVQLQECLQKVRQVTSSRFVLLNGEQQQAFELGFDGVQISRHRLTKQMGHARLENFWIGASCHDSKELALANQVADFALLSPVQATSSHPEAKGMGWGVFEQLVSKAKLPCYALGGMSESDISKAQSVGGQGVAAISAIWSRS